MGHLILLRRRKLESYDGLGMEWNEEDKNKMQTAVKKKF
jgi:hypothetical protein